MIGEITEKNKHVADRERENYFKINVRCKKYWVIKIFSNNWIAHESGSYQAQWQFLSLVYVVKIRERKR